MVCNSPMCLCPNWTSWRLVSIGFTTFSNAVKAPPQQLRYWPDDVMTSYHAKHRDIRRGNIFRLFFSFFLLIIVISFKKRESLSLFLLLGSCQWIMQFEMQYSAPSCGNTRKDIDLSLFVLTQFLPVTTVSDFWLSHLFILFTWRHLFHGWN